MRGKEEREEGLQDFQLFHLREIRTPHQWRQTVSHHSSVINNTHLDCFRTMQSLRGKWRIKSPNRKVGRGWSRGGQAPLISLGLLNFLNGNQQCCQSGLLDKHGNCWKKCIIGNFAFVAKQHFPQGSMAGHSLKKIKQLLCDKQTVDYWNLSEKSFIQ